MIITLRGTHHHTKAVVEAGALLAASTALVKSKKTILLQFTATETVSALNVLRGKELQANMINGMKVFEEDGLDTLAMYSDTQQIGKEQLDDTTSAIMEKANLFDVLKPSNQKEFYETLDVSALRKIIDGAKEVYDYVYVILPSNEYIVKKICELADENIIVVPHGPASTKYVKTEDKKPVSYLVTDYEPNSKFSAKILQKAYGTKRLYTIPHNYLYKDALLDNNLLGFVLTNKKNMKEDINYAFTSSVMKLLNRYVAGTDDDEDNELDLPTKPKAKDQSLKPVENQPLPDDAAQEIVVQKGKLFKRRDKQVTINL